MGHRKKRIDFYPNLITRICCSGSSLFWMLVILITLHKRTSRCPFHVALNFPWYFEHIYHSPTNDGSSATQPKNTLLTPAAVHLTHPHVIKHVSAETLSDTLHWWHKQSSALLISLPTERRPAWPFPVIDIQNGAKIKLTCGQIPVQSLRSKHTPRPHLAPVTSSPLEHSGLSCTSQTQTHKDPECITSITLSMVILFYYWRGLFIFRWVFFFCSIGSRAVIWKHDSWVSLKPKKTRPLLKKFFEWQLIRQLDVLENWV